MRAAPSFAALAVLAAAALPAPASALDVPQPAGRDRRIRVVAYDRDGVVQIYAAPGATVRIEISPDETVEAVLTSDQAVMGGEVEVEEAGAPQPRQGGGQQLACDANLCRSVHGNFIYFKPVRELEPQPLFVQTKRCDPQGRCIRRPYAFELLTRLGALVEHAPNTYYGVRFDYPADRLAAAAARANAGIAARRSAAAERSRTAGERDGAALLRGAQIGPALNQAYTVTGDRAVLGAPR